MAQPEDHRAGSTELVRGSLAPGELDRQRDHKYGAERDWPRPVQDDASHDPENGKCNQSEHLRAKRLLGELPARSDEGERVQGLTSRA